MIVSYWIFERSIIRGRALRHCVEKWMIIIQLQVLRHCNSMTMSTLISRPRHDRARFLA